MLDTHRRAAARDVLGRVITARIENGRGYATLQFSSAADVEPVWQRVADGTLQSVRADARGRTVGGQIVMTPWEGRWLDVQVRDGMKVPLSGEVAWLTPEGRKPYWRGTITSVRYGFAP